MARNSTKRSVASAVKKGGEAVKRKYGPSFYEKIGKKGGQRVKELIEQGKRAESL